MTGEFATTFKVPLFCRRISNKYHHQYHYHHYHHHHHHHYVMFAVLTEFAPANVIPVVAFRLVLLPTTILKLVVPASSIPVVCVFVPSWLHYTQRKVNV